jgi:hypothetical protein
VDRSNLQLALFRGSIGEAARRATRGPNAKRVYRRTWRRVDQLLTAPGPAMILPTFSGEKKSAGEMVPAFILTNASIAG